MEEPGYRLERVAPFPERHLWYGYGGVGKTTAIGTFAAYQPQATFWVADTDVSRAYERLIYTEVPFAEEQFKTFELEEWPDFEAFMETVMTNADPATDWLVIDNATWLWTEVQSYLVEQITGNDVDEHLVELRKSVKGDRQAFMAAVGATMNWDLINKTYQRKVNAKLHKWRGNAVLICEGEETTRRDADDRDNSAYVGLGVKPRGQKGIHYVMRSTILMKRDTKGRYTATTVKDQGREDMESTKISAPDDGGFAVDYLQEIAGWKVGKR